MTGTLTERGEHYLPPIADLDRTPGEEFAAAIGTSPDADDDLVVPFHRHLPTAFSLFASPPRYPVRHLLKTAQVADRPATFVYEPPTGALSAAGTSYASTPEAAFAPQLAWTPLTDLVARVPMPVGLLERPELVASFVDYRVLVRLSVVENQSLLTGTEDGAITGLLNLPGTRHIDSPLGLAGVITEAAAEVEETGGPRSTSRRSCCAARRQTATCGSGMRTCAPPRASC